MWPFVKIRRPLVAIVTNLCVCVCVCVKVISRIYYCVNRSWSGRIVLPELRKSNLLQVGDCRRISSVT